ncbi:MAG: cytochrome c biogenesis protein ResB [Candidatus Brocadiales bacterium]
MAKVVKNAEASAKNSLLWNTFVSVKLAVVLIFLMALACVLGTFIVQDKLPQEYISRYGEGLASIVQLLQLNCIFQSYGFILLLVLLCTNLSCCTIERWRGDLLQMGFLLTHISIILILIGSIIGLKFGHKGVIWIAEGDRVHQFQKRDASIMQLPFELELVKFITEKHPGKFDFVTYIKDQHREKVLPVDIGVVQAVPKSPYTVTIKEYYPDAALLEEAVNSSDDVENPAIFVQLYASKDVAVEGWLVAKDRNSYVDAKRDLKLEYQWFNSAEALDKAATQVVAQEKPSLTVTVEEKKVTKTFPVEIGKSVSIEGYDIKFLELTLNFTRKDLPLSQQQPVNPAVRIELKGPEATEARWVFANFPDWDKMHPTKNKGLKLTCIVPKETSFVSQHIRILQGPDNKRVFTFIKDNKVVETTDWELEKKYAIGDTDHVLAVSKFYPHFSLKQSVVNRSDELNKPALHVEVNGPAGPLENWIFADAKQPTPYLDGNFFLLYEQFGENIKDWKSTLRVIDGGEVVLEKTIEVNDPLKYGGFSFYQSSYDPENPKISGLQVARDPGIAMVYTGFSTLCFGIIFIFYLKPLLRKRRSQAKKAEEEEK